MTTILLSGVSAGLFGCIGALVAVKIKTPQIFEAAMVEADAYIAGLPERLRSDPKFVNELVSPIIQAGMAQLGVSKSNGGGAKTMNIGGFKIPVEIASAGMDMLGGLIKNKAGATAAQAVESILP